MNRRELLKDASLATAVSLVVFGEAQAQAQGAIVRVLVTYHSVTGNTEKMAHGVVEGAKGVSGTDVVLKRISLQWQGGYDAGHHRSDALESNDSGKRRRRVWCERDNRARFTWDR
jgi:hypothetical protein